MHSYSLKNKLESKVHKTIILNKHLKFIKENNYKITSLNMMKNPVHIEPYHIPYIYNLLKTKNKIFLTPKADGISTQITMSDMILETEKIVEPNNTRIKYFITDIVKTLHKYDSNKIISFNEISGRLSFLNYYLPKNNSVNIIVPLIINDDNVITFQNKIKDILNQNILICSGKDEDVYIKPVFDIMVQTKNLTTITKFLEQLFVLYETPYPNDGWIVYIPKKNTPIKIKPTCQLTIDMKYTDGYFFVKDNTVHSINSSIKFDPFYFKMFPEEHMIYTNDHNIFLENNKIYHILPQKMDEKCLTLKILSERKDKIIPNRMDTIESVLYRILKEWSVNKIINQYDLNPITYYDINKQFDMKSNKYADILLKLQRFIARTYVADCLNEKDIHVLDLGCGNGSFGHKLLKNKTIHMYYGLDIDPVLLADNIGHPSNMYLLWGDFNNDVEFFTSYLSDGHMKNITTFTSINSVHYFDLIKLDNLISSLKHKSKNESNDQHTKLIIFTMFSESIKNLLSDDSKIIFDQNFLIEYLINQSTSDTNSDTYRFTYPWKSKPFIEKIYRKEYLVNTLKSCGWELMVDKQITLPINYRQMINNSSQSHPIMDNSIYSVENTQIENTQIETKTMSLDIIKILPESYRKFITLHNVLVFMN